ncbi:hypothetical protein A5893_10610 [Pedobacter psychrophilus]|uniref:TonB C-terminal domain-containing protein n=1 Tax=Pedobacter psychrophilus TaxID=1826909 RepID=A0A179DF60_9SPHI|nr:hypothetical protein [Pedobacter psychrophilus]OAQ39113.1 hypothetical protein A5893_10610 [Pedobacter psychrophilus]
MKKTLTFFILLFSIKSNAQKLYSTTFLKFSNQEVKSKDSADFIRYIYFPENGALTTKLIEIFKNDTLKKEGLITVRILPLNGFEGEVKEYFENGNLKTLNYYDKKGLSSSRSLYYKNGSLKEQGSDKRLNGFIKHKTKQFYDNGVALLDSLGNGHVIYKDEDDGTIKEGDFKKGFMNGSWKTFDINHQLIFEDFYVDGDFKKGITYNETEMPIVYKRINTYAYADNYGYNKNRLNGYYGTVRNGSFEGTVLYFLDIDKEGKLSNIRLKTSLNEKKDNQLLENITKAKWHPATFRGKPIEDFNYEFALFYNIN